MPENAHSKLHSGEYNSAAIARAEIAMAIENLAGRMRFSS